MKRDLLLCFIGESGSGKSTIIDMLEKLDGYNYVRSYTTRSPRYDGEDTHIFFPKEEFKEEIVYGEDIIAWTKFDGNYYWASKSQYKGKGISLYALDVKGFYDVLSATKGDDTVKVIGIYLKADEFERFKRMKETRGIEEAQRRIEHDKEKFKVVRCDYVVDANRSIADVYNMVKEILRLEYESD